MFIFACICHYVPGRGRAYSRSPHVNVSLHATALQRSPMRLHVSGLYGRYPSTDICPLDSLSRSKYWTRLPKGRLRQRNRSDLEHSIYEKPCRQDEVSQQALPFSPAPTRLRLPPLESPLLLVSRLSSSSCACRQHCSLQASLHQQLMPHQEPKGSARYDSRCSSREDVLIK